MQLLVNKITPSLVLVVMKVKIYLKVLNQWKQWNTAVLTLQASVKLTFFEFELFEWLVQHANQLSYEVEFTHLHSALQVTHDRKYLLCFVRFINVLCLSVQRGTASNRDFSLCHPFSTRSWQPSLILFEHPCLLVWLLFMNTKSVNVMFLSVGD